MKNLEFHASIDETNALIIAVYNKSIGAVVARWRFNHVSEFYATLRAHGLPVGNNDTVRITLND